VIVYVDTSAALKLVVDEPESAALAETLQRHRDAGDVLVSSLLLHTEMHCAANRRPDVVNRDLVAQALSTIDLVALECGDLLTAPLLPGRLRSADALHLAAALRTGAEVMVAYDRELAAAARNAGLDAQAPGAPAPAD
jgi:predicted nucleic acid-binding protein